MNRIHGDARCKILCKSSFSSVLVGFGVILGAATEVAFPGDIKGYIPTPLRAV